MAKPDSLIFLFDENISRHIPQILKLLGVCQNATMSGLGFNSRPDEEWIPRAAAQNLILISQDRKQLAVPTILNALVESRIRVFYLPRQFMNMKRYDQTLTMLKLWPRILDHAAKMKPGELVQIQGNYRFKILNLKS